MSARSSAYGIQPIWPSLYANLSFGNCGSFPLNSQSASDAIELLKASVPPTPSGASGDALGSLDDDPMCMHRVTPVSFATESTGSQCPVWMLGRPSRVGSSLKQNA